MELFSILIANYNNSEFLKTALDSVLSQTFNNWEVIIVDDASTDNFQDVIKSYKKDSRIRVFINQANYGCGFTKRRCAGLATGDIMGFLDPDDALHPAALETLVEAHRLNPSASIIHTTHYICDDKLNTIRKAPYTAALMQGTPYLLVNDGRIHHFASFKKIAYTKTPGISARNKKAVDQDLYYKLEETGSVIFIDQPLYYYRIHKGSISNFGKEAETTLWHYGIILESCKRRINKLDSRNKNDREWIKKYRIHFRKISIFYSFRKKNWLTFLVNLFAYSLTGGMNNLVQYAKKLPRGGISQIKKSFVTNYSIK
jgi:glycosyltransferase involved in cell wall biosynthesis